MKKIDYVQLSYFSEIPSATKAKLLRADDKEVHAYYVDFIRREMIASTTFSENEAIRAIVYDDGSAEVGGFTFQGAGSYDELLDYLKL